MTIEDVEAKAQRLYNGVILAPMVRASTTPLRTLALKYGADAVYTEELMDRSVITSTREVLPDGMIEFRRDTTKWAEKTRRNVSAKYGGQAPILLKIDPFREAGRLICQLGTGEPHLALQAALIVHRDVAAIDINMGCPRKFSVAGGMGSALLTDPERASNIIRTLRLGLPEIPVSCKIRLIKNTQATVDFCTAMVHAGALAIAIHARYVDDESTKAADWKTLREVVPVLKSKFPSMPIMVNGDFYTRQEWTGMMEETGANGVLLSRSALYNTSIFRKPTAGDVGPFLHDSPLLLDKTTVIQDYLRECSRYNTYYKNVKYVICEMMNHCRNHPERRIQMPQIYPGGQTIPMVCNSKSSNEVCRLWNLTTEDGTSGMHNTSADHHCYEDSYFLKEHVVERKDD